MKIPNPTPYRWAIPFASESFAQDQVVRIENINCKACRSFEKCRSVEDRPWDYEKKVVSPIRRCAMRAIEDGLNGLAAGASVLEVGCGDWDYAKTRVENKGGTWTGVDIHETPLTSKVFDGRSLPFNDAEFDMVIANQVLEHVHDVGLPPNRVVEEWARVLKPGGSLHANVPIHLHGSRHFRLGDLDAILRMFRASTFTSLTVVYYRRDHDGMGPARALIDYSPGGWVFDRYMYIDDNETWSRKPVRQKIKLVIAAAKLRCIEAVGRMLSVDVYPVNHKLLSSYVIDIRSVKR